MALVSGWRALHIDITAFRQDQVSSDLVKSTGSRITACRVVVKAPSPTTP
jgi:hypothetical protein